jgi:hypothetical protein
MVECVLSLLASDEVRKTVIEVRALFTTEAVLSRYVALTFVYYIYFRGSLSRYIDSTGLGRSGDRVPGAMSFSASVQTDLGARAASCTTSAWPVCRGKTPGASI